MSSIAHSAMLLKEVEEDSTWAGVSGEARDTLGNDCDCLDGRNTGNLMFRPSMCSLTVLYKHHRHGLNE